MSGKTSAAVDETKAPAAGEEAAPAKKGLPPIAMKIALFGGILLVLAIGSFALVTFVIAPKLRAQPMPTEGAAGEHGAAGDHGAADAKDHDKKAAHGEIVELGDVVVNPAGSGGRRYLKAVVSIEVKDAKIAKELEHRKAPVLDLLVRELSSRSLEELTDPVTKEEMRSALVTEIDGLLHPGSVLDLFFTEYVVQ